MKKADAKEKETIEEEEKEEVAAASALSSSSLSEELVAEVVPVVEEEEEETEVKSFEFGGKKYLKDESNTLYDTETKEDIGYWNEEEQRVEMYEDEDEDEEA